MEEVIDDHVGIIRGVTEVPSPSGAPDFFHYAAEACDTSAFLNRKNFPQAGGASSDRRLAMAKAVGEAVERYCSAIFIQEECPLARAESAVFQCIDPSEFALFSAEQYVQPHFRYVPFTRNTLLRWTEATDLFSQASTYLPACMVYVPYDCDIENGEQAITQSISTGLACHGSWVKAAISAICEVIERDAFTITWQAMLSVPPIRLESLSQRNRDLVERFHYAGDSIRLLNITLDHGVPSILSVLSSCRPQSPGLAFAAASSPDPEEAVRKSLEELAHTRRHAVQLKARTKRFEAGPEYVNITNQETHVLLFADQANRGLADFIFSSEGWINFHDLPDLSDRSPDAELHNIVRAIRSTNHRVLVKDLTTPDVMSLGLFVVRAIIPGFHPLFMGHRQRGLGGVRLWTVPQKLGYRGIESSDNPVPHPFP